MIIAIDGPAGAGKSTVARAVARELGLRFLDTGAMYRAVTLAALDAGVHPGDAPACARLARALALAFDDEGKLLVDGASAEPAIRGETVTLNVSAVSAHREVREAIVAKQRELALLYEETRGGVVAEGRDTTTVVFPEADFKFFLVASAAERARRRAEQDGTPERLDAIREDIERRDRLDTTRAHSPLRRAPDAVVIDSDGLAADEVTARIVARVRERT